MRNGGAQQPVCQPPGESSMTQIKASLSSAYPRWTQGACGPDNETVNETIEDTGPAANGTAARQLANLSGLST